MCFWRSVWFGFSMEWLESGLVSCIRHMKADGDGISSAAVVQAHSGHEQSQCDISQMVTHPVLRYTKL
jgi:hypothetical protein